MGPASVLPFSPENLFLQLAAEPCLPSDVSSNPRAKYLASYLAAIGAVTIVTELEYVDADYLDDYASFYAKSFERIPNRCRRLHFFSRSFDEESFEALILADQSDQELQEQYLGFVVARPLPTAVIGRTALVTYASDGGRRQYPASREYSVNLFGTTLQVLSLAFQEQDTSLAACATVALWSCFQKTQILFQSLAPTPVAITRAANKLLLAARPFPSRGLKIEQICNAITAVGLDPEVYLASADLPLVSLAYSYLRLGLPVLAVVDIPNVGWHAIALNGYSLRPTQQLSSEGANVNNLLPKLVGLRIDELYGHDDQNGPFARLKLIPPSTANPTVLFGQVGSWQGNLTPVAMVVPVYPKIRTGFREVLRNLPVLSMVASWISDASKFEWDVYLAKTNEMKTDLRTRVISAPEDVRRTLLISALPKYVWRCSLRSEGATVLEALLDTTAMVNGFPIRTLWWADPTRGKMVRAVASNSVLAAQLEPQLGARLIRLLAEA